MNILERKEDEFDHFGKVVAAFLRKLDGKKQRMAQLNFQKLMLKIEYGSEKENLSKSDKDA